MIQIKRYLKVVVFALIGIAILWYITKGQDLERIWQEFKEAQLIWILLAILAGCISHYLRALRWNLLIHSMNYKTKTSTTFYALMTGYLANLALPRLGEVTRCATLSKYGFVPFNSIAGTVVAERVFDMICLLSLILLTIVFQFSFLRDFLSVYVFDPLEILLQGNMITLMVAGIIVMAGFLFLWLYFRKVSHEKQSLSGKIKRQLMGFWKGMISLAVVERKMLFLTYSIFIWFFYFLTVYLCFFALEATSGLGVDSGLTILALGSLGVVAPVPGGIGAYHFIVIKTLTELMDIAIEPATSYAYLAHATQMVVILILGAYSWMMLSAKAKKHTL